MKRLLSLLAVLPFCIISLSVSAEKRETYSRVLWEKGSNVSICGGVYARVKELPNGQWLMVASAGKDIITAFSNDEGHNWSSTTIVSPPPLGGMNYTNAEALVLRNGNIILGWNERLGDNPSSREKYGITCRVSTDNGITWGDTVHIFTGLSIKGDGCWEPAFLELPNGDIQCYFANETPFSGINNDQEISMCVSKDGGKTWSKDQRISYRAGHRDGMPVPIILEDGKTIAVAIEDNGTTLGGGMKPVIVRTTVENCWSEGWVDATSSRRNNCFDSRLYTGSGGGAPYITKLLTGETLVSFQCTGNGRTYEDLFCAIGDKDARHFHLLQEPLQSPDNNHCRWNSLTTMSNGDIIACGSQGPTIVIRKGHPINAFHADYGPIYIDGKWDRKNEHYYNSEASQAILGYERDGRWVIDLSYSKHYLNVYAKVTERTMTSDEKSMNDGIRVLLDLKDVCSAKPQAGIFDITCDLAGNITIKEGDNGMWTAKPDMAHGIWTKNEQKTGYYTMEIAIPWSMLGITDRNQVTGGISFERCDRNGSQYIEETVPGCERFKAYTWLPLILGEMPSNVKDDDDIFDYDNVLSDLSHIQCQKSQHQAYTLMGAPTDPTTKGYIIKNNRIVFNQ